MGLATDYIENVSIQGDKLTFSYKISEQPYEQWFAFYRGALPGWDDLKSYLKYDYITNYNKTAREGTISYVYEYFRRGEIYTVGLYRTKDWGLADYHEIIA